jgi:hypothetical protein
MEVHLVTENTPTTRNVFIAALLVAVALAVVPAALAGKGGNGGGKAGQNESRGSFSLVPLNSADGLPHWGQQVTFSVTSSATYDFVTVMCYQGGAWVYGSSQNFGFGSATPQAFYLKSVAWTGGAADCNAELWASTSSGTYQQTLATTSFHVYA